MDQPSVFGRDFFFGMSALCSIGFFRRELLQRFEIIRIAFEFAERIDQRTQTRNFFDIGLGAFAVVPEIGRGHSRFERG